jgi:hypothetical protein
VLAEHHGSLTFEKFFNSKESVMSEIIDLGLRVRDIERYLVKSRYWATNEKRNRHAFVLSSCAYELAADEKVHLETVAKSLYAAVVYLENTLATLSKQKKLNHSEAARQMGLGDKIYDIYANCGNVVSAAIPAAMVLALKDGSLRRGMRVLAAVASAGMSFSLAYFRF